MLFPTAKDPLHNRPAASRCFDVGRSVAAVLALTLGLQVAARADAPLRWKFKPGETVRYTLVQKTDTKMELASGQSITSKVRHDSDIRWIVKSVSPEGIAEVAQAIDRVRIRMEAPGQPVFEFDTASKESPPEGPVAAQMVPMFRALAGLECTLMMDPRGEIRDVRIADSVLESIQKSLPAGPAAQMLSKESLKNMVGQSSLILPKEAVAKGKTWTEKSKMPANQFGTMVIDKTYTYQGAEAAEPTHIRIDLNTKTTLEPAANSPVELELKNQDGKGQIVFDSEKGRIVSSHLDMSMTQKIKAGGQELDQTVVNQVDMKQKPDEAAK
jgi:Family of unknown function (DUF6263)